MRFTHHLYFETILQFSNFTFKKKSLKMKQSLHLATQIRSTYQVKFKGMSADSICLKSLNFVNSI